MINSSYVKSKWNFAFISILLSPCESAQIHANTVVIDVGEKMKDFTLLPRVSICHAPTALELAPRMSKKLNCQLYFKRDDCTGLAGGGNKARKLEYLIADAKAQGADTLVTVGGLQSNHARQTAAAAAKFGFDCTLVLEDVAGTPKADFYTNGNVLLDKLCGATIHRLGEDQDLLSKAEQVMGDLKAQGKSPYFVPMGGSNVIGALGYVRCAFEILQQIESQDLQIDQIVVSTGSAGTQAGLIAGLIAAGSDIPVLGINVSRKEEEQTALVEGLLHELLVYLELDPTTAVGRVFTNGDYYGQGYGIPTPEMLSAVNECASLEGILLDPVYTGKGMSGLIDLIAKQQIKRGSHPLFLHTGGSQALFAYTESF